MAPFIKTYLLAPGPTPVPESVLTAMNQPIPHHRTAAFETVMAEVRQGLKKVFGTEQEVLLLAASGTGGMEAAISNLFSPGDEVLTLAAGKFGERWTKLAQAYGLKPTEIRAASPGDTIPVAAVEAALAKNKNLRGVLFQASETSTGVSLPTQAICAAAKKAGVLTICDAITACGVFELPMDRWGIDVLITGSQKAFMIPPGLAMLALSPAAWARTEEARLPRFYFDLKREKAAIVKNQTAWTPAISLILGLREALQMMLKEGLPQAYARHEILGRATRAACAALGLKPLAPAAPSPAVTAVWLPAAVKDGKTFVKRLRDHYGVILVGGQDELDGKILRLSHFGYCGAFDITTGISALELALTEAGHPFELGAGVTAALRIFAEKST